MKINPGVIRTHEINEIELRILIKEQMEREREKKESSLNNNLDNIFKIFSSCFKKSKDEFVHYIIEGHTIYFPLDYYRNIVRERKAKTKNNIRNDKDKEKNLNDKKESKEFFPNLIVIDSESPKFNKCSMRLYYSRRLYYIILFLNVFFPGIGTIIAAIGWGNTCKYKNRTKELLFRGIIQFLTIIFFVGWIQSICDAKNYFEYNIY